MLATDRWIPIAGTVGVFRTDTRVFNPSATKDIEVTARFLPAGAANNNERVAAPGVTFTVPKRGMKVLDDVVTQLFSASGIGGIFFTSNDDFIATSRIYAQTATGTLGQFSDALAPGAALTKGVLIQLKSITGGAFRTNIGLASPTNATTNITFRLYDKTNTLVVTKPMTVPAYAVVAPTNITALIGGGSADLSDAWLSFTSDNPIFVYASVIDNATTDPTFIAAQPDTGTELPVEEIKTFNVTLSSFEIDIAPDVVLKKGEQVKFRVRSANATHGFQLIAPSGVTLIPSMIYLPSTPAQEYTITVNETGTYTYFCTNANCGEGHNDMIGDFAVTN